MKQSITTLACILGVLLFLGAVAWAGDGQTDIATLPYTISQPGSYIVTDDLTLTTLDTNGITITTDSVTLDLNGHCLTGPGKAAGSSGDGIYVNPSHYNIAIRNGTIRDWRGYGVYANQALNSQLESLRCYNNGQYGMGAGSCSKVIGNTCRQNGGRGIYANPSCTVTGNTCEYNGDDGIYAGSGSTVAFNTCGSNDDDGIQANFSAITGNTCYSNTGDGIQVAYNCRVVDNTCNINGYSTGDGAGIHATGFRNTIEHNMVTENDRGLDLDSANNIVSGNALISNTTPVDAVAGNQLDILISELPYTISQPGMYRLSGDLSLSTLNTSGITISASNVTLDLNGHALTGPGKAAGTSGYGVFVSSGDNIAIRNGTVRDWRVDGVYTGSAYSTQLEGLRCYSNGDDGINLSNGCSKISGNTCYNNDGDGIAAAFGCVITGNACRDNGGDGINSDNCTISGNACYSNTGDGIESTNSLVSENSCVNNGTNYNLTTCTSANNH